ncbi:MAG: ABC transporter permease [Gemmatimonadales bacterium]|nr:ABC transporter permease [Gemmatimonadales bacterium]
MHKVWAVVRREFLERVRTRAFLLGTLLFPLLMLGLTLLPVLLERRETAPKRIAVVDASTGEAGPRVVDALAAARRGEGGAARYVVTRVPAEGDGVSVRDTLVRRTGTEGEGTRYDGILVLTDDGVAKGRIPYYGTNVGSPNDMRRLEAEVQTALRLERLRRAGIDPFTAMPALRPIDLQTAKVTAGTLTGESGGASFLLAYIMGFVLYFAMVLYGVQVMNAVVEEKTSRIAEVLASSLTPFQMMLGKVLGVGGAGLLQLGVWGITAMAVTTYRTQLARMVGASPEMLSQMQVPDVRPDLLLVFLVFFVLGFLLYSSLYAAVAAMCNSQQEAQQANTPVTLLIVAGFMAVFALLNEPSGTLARTLSLVPFLAPFVVPVRYSLAPIPLPELLLSIAITLATMLAVVWLAGRIYRTGILMYGKRPSFAEVLRWVGER